MFDDNGDCLDPNLIEEITASVGKVTIEKPKTDYKVNIMAVMRCDCFAENLFVCTNSNSIRSRHCSMPRSFRMSWKCPASRWNSKHPT